MIASLCALKLRCLVTNQIDSRRSPSLVLARLPLQELLEQLLALGRGVGPDIGSGRALAGQELIELIARRRRRLSRLPLAILREPFVGSGEPRPAWQRRGEIGLAPFRMVRRLLQRGDLGKERIDETGDAPITIG